MIGKFIDTCIFILVHCIIVWMALEIVIDHKTHEKITMEDIHEGNNHDTPHYVRTMESVKNYLSQTPNYLLVFVVLKLLNSCWRELM